MQRKVGKRSDLNFWCVERRVIREDKRKVKNVNRFALIKNLKCGKKRNHLNILQ